MKKPMLVVSLMLSSLLFSCATNQVTSEIPDRREFPVNPEISPCQDFFQYACSQAINNFKLREDRSRHIFSFNDSSERLLVVKKDYLKSLLDETDLNQKSRQLKSYYASCMDQTARAAEEKDLLKKETSEVMAIKTKKDFMKYLTQQGLRGEHSHLSFGNDNNLDDSDIYDFILIPNRLTTMPDKSYYANQELMKEFEQIASDFFKLAGFENYQERAKWVVEFEANFIKNYPTPAEMREVWSKRAYSSKRAMQKYNNLELEAVLAKVPNKIKLRTPMNDVFNYVNKEVAKTDLEKLKSVYLFQATHNLLDEGYPEFFKKNFDFSHKYLGGSPVRPSIEERCAMDTMDHFDKEMDYELFDKVFPDFPVKKFVGLLEQVRSSIIEGLTKNTWLSAKAKGEAIKKMRAATFQVVKPMTEKEWNFNPEAEYSAQTYIQNQRKLSANLIEREFQRLPNKIDKTLWWRGPLIVNAWYNSGSNSFVMPAGILQYPFYDPKLPDWVNLGAVGAVVGHELGHGVDDQGSKYDDKGRLRQWMTNKDVKTFRKRGESLIAQFQAAGHNGELTLGENIGDLVGVTFALNAAHKVMPVDPVARDRATKDFFLQWARAWCGVMRPKKAEMQLKTDPHALVWARVNEQMKHQGEFARVYQCKEGDKLYLAPEKRVTIW